MKRIRNVLISGMMIWVFTGPSALLNAQTTINDVINTFNDGAQLVSDGSFEDAVTKFEECYNLATELGEEGNNMKTKAAEQIPALHYRMAMDNYKARDIEGAIAKFKDAMKAGNKYGDEEIAGKSEKYIPQLYNLVGKTYVRQDKSELALSSFDSALVWNPEYAQAIFNKGMVYKASDDNEKMISLMDESIKVGKNTGDDKTVQAASEVMREYYSDKAIAAINSENDEVALEMSDKSLQYDKEFSDPYYYKALIYNKQQEYDMALENAQKALDYADEETNTSRIYFELGNAYSGNVDYQKACDAFSKCTREPYLSRAKHKKEVLSCQ